MEKILLLEDFPFRVPVSVPIMYFERATIDWLFQEISASDWEFDLGYDWGEMSMCFKNRHHALLFTILSGKDC